MSAVTNQMIHCARSLAEVVGEEVASQYVSSTVRQICRAYADVSSRLVSLKFTEITPLSHYAVKYRLERAYALLHSLRASRVSVYEPCIIGKAPNLRLVFPPIVERWGDMNYLMDGTHRLLAAKEVDDLDTVRVLQLEANEFPPLPCSPTSWNTIQVERLQRPTEEVLQPLNRAYFRPVTVFFNSDQFLINSERELAKLSKPNKTTEKP